jgi:hypothetical protein
MSTRGVIHFLAMLPLGKGRRIGWTGGGDGVPSILAQLLPAFGALALATPSPSPELSLFFPF